MPQWPQKLTVSGPCEFIAHRWYGLVIVKDIVEKHNKTFLDQLPPEVAAKVQLSIVESPPPSSSSAAPSPPRRAKSD
jgi:hypothetical protein